VRRGKAVTEGRRSLEGKEREEEGEGETRRRKKD
jgi:hypothetical protein